MSKTNGHSPLSQPHMPADTAAEAGLLSCIAQNNLEVFPAAEREGVRSIWFDDMRHQKWYNLFRDMTAAHQKVDSVTISSRLRDEFYDAINLNDYATLLTTSPSAANWPYYIPPLRRCYIRRTTIRACFRAIEIAEDESENHENLLSDLSHSVQGIWPPADFLPEVQDGSEMADAMYQEPSQLIHGLMHQGTTFALGGGSKTCKTWVLIDLAASVATGTPWLGCETKKAKVLFLNMEIMENFFGPRLKKVLKEKGISLDRNQLEIWNLRDFTAPYNQLIPKIMERTRLMGYSLIVLDPIYMMYGDLKENDSGDISKLMTELGKLRRQSGAAIAFAAHFSKGNQAEKEVLDRISGSGVFGRNPDSIVTLTALKTEGCFSIDAVLRNMAPCKAFGVRWDYPLMRREDKLDPTDLKKPGGRKKGYEESKVAALLSEKNLATKDWQKRAYEELGLSRATFFRAMQDLETSRAVLKMTDGSWALNLKFKPPEIDENMDTTA